MLGGRAVRDALGLAERGVVVCLSAASEAEQLQLVLAMDSH